MARRPVSETTAVPRGWPEPPFMMVDSASVAGTKLLILARSALAWLGVEYCPYDYVRDIVVHDRHAARVGTRGKRFYPWEHNGSVKDHAGGFRDHVRNLRVLALRDGATPEAIRLLDGISPFTMKEVSDMAGKLAKKNEAPAKEAKPAKAEKTSNRKGNPEALAKARAARAEAGPDVRKITILNKDNPYREGSGRAESFAALKGAKTVEDYKQAGGKVKYISRWEAEGIIKLS